MIDALTAVAGIVVLPLVVAWGYGRLLVKLSGREERADSLDTRWGYSLSDVRGYWTALGSKGRAAEARFLRWDLSYPLVYGGALGAGGFFAWSRLALPMPALALAPIAIASLADWVENFVQLRQLRRYERGGEAAVAEVPIRLASAATVLKLAFLCLSLLILLVLAALLLFGAFGSRG